MWRAVLTDTKIRAEKMRTEGWESWDSLKGISRNFGIAKIDAHRMMICGGENIPTCDADAVLSKIKNEDCSACVLWDCERKSWSPLADIPSHMPYCRAVFLKGHVYVLNNIQEFYRLDTLDLPNEWERRRDSKEVGSGFSLVACDRYIYLTGGYLSPQSASRYDPIIDEWKELPDMPIGRHNHEAVFLSGKLYVIGGRSILSKTALNSLQIFYKNNWMDGPNLPRGLMGHSAAVSFDSIIVTGGKPTKKLSPVATIYVLNISSLCWTAIGYNLPIPICDHVSVTTDFKIYIVGGYHDNIQGDNVTIYCCDLARFHKDSTVYFNEPDSHRKRSLCFFC